MQIAPTRVGTPHPAAPAPPGEIRLVKIEDCDQSLFHEKRHQWYTNYWGSAGNRYESSERVLRWVPGSGQPFGYREIGRQVFSSGTSSEKPLTDAEKQAFVNYRTAITKSGLLDLPYRSGAIAGPGELEIEVAWNSGLGRSEQRDWIFPQKRVPAAAKAVIEATSALRRLINDNR